MNASFLFVDDVDVASKTILLRLDINVPVADGVVTDDTRIQRILPGLQALRAAGARTVILSHFGRPKGSVMPEYSLAPIAHHLSGLLGADVPLEADVIGPGGQAAVAGLEDGAVMMMENLRFYPGEEANDADFAAALAALGDVYVGDAFSCTHRAHASVEALPRMMSVAAAGQSLGAELTALEAALAAPKRPVAAVVGGAKVSTKLAVLENLVERVDSLILGGGMANTFLLAQGHDMGASLVEADMVDTAQSILAKAESCGCKILLPEDALLATEFAANAPHREGAVSDIKPGEMMLDAGPAAIATIVDHLQTCRTVVWNGPMGAFEITPFDTATTAVATAVAARSQAGEVMSVAGGGETLAALANAGVSDHFSYVSTAGGAFLEWLEGKTLPGVEALRSA